MLSFCSPFSLPKFAFLFCITQNINSEKKKNSPIHNLKFSYFNYFKYVVSLLFGSQYISCKNNYTDRIDVRDWSNCFSNKFIIAEKYI